MEAGITAQWVKGLNDRLVLSASVNPQALFGVIWQAGADIGVDYMLFSDKSLGISLGCGYVSASGAGSGYDFRSTIEFKF